MSDIPIFELIYILVAAVISLEIAFNLNRKLKKKNFRYHHYRWGFFNGCFRVSILPLFFYELLTNPLPTEAVDWGVLWVVFLWSLSGIYIIRRKRWGWAAGSALDLNPILWIINIIYTRKRWDEFNKNVKLDQPSPFLDSFQPEPSIPQKLPPLPPDQPSDPPFFLAIQGKCTGPHSLDQIQALWKSGQAPASSCYWQQGMKEWNPLMGLLLNPSPSTPNIPAESPKTEPQFQAPSTPPA